VRSIGSITVGLLVWFALCAPGCGASKSGNSQETDTKSASEVVTEEPANAAKGRIVTASFRSKSLGVEKKYIAYLPGSYDTSSTAFPVIYMLHGLGGQEDNWSKHMKLTEAADAMALSAIVIMPDGDNSFYSNSKTEADFDACMKGSSATRDMTSRQDFCVKSAHYEDYIVSDLVGHVDASYRTMAEAKARAIGGLSMGGYGALMLAMRHKDVFTSAASHSGVTALLYMGPRPFVAGKEELADDPVAFTNKMGRFGPLFRGIFGDTIENWREHDPAFLAKSLNPGELSIYIDCGTEDEFHLQYGASYLHEILKGRSIEHAFALLPGHHNPAFWGDRIDDSLAFHVKHFETTGALPGR
jgi:S-formylglutathione hydrolase FrmB